MGIGPGQFLARFFVEAHDTFLQVGAEMGIVGFVPVVALYVLALTRSARRTLLASDPEEVRASAWITGAVVAMAVVAATLTLLGVKEMWALLAAAAIPVAEPTEFRSERASRHRPHRWAEGTGQPAVGAVD